MKATVIFDSKFGNTQKIAEAMAEELGEGTRCIPVEKADGTALNCDLIIVGSPINAWAPTPAMKNFLAGLTADSLKNIPAAAFDTRIKSFLSGNAAKKIGRMFESAGARLVVPGKGFYVSGTEGPLLDKEVERARAWARSVRLKALSLGEAS